MASARRAARPRRRSSTNASRSSLSAWCCCSRNSRSSSCWRSSSSRLRARASAREARSTASNFTRRARATRSCCCRSSACRTQFDPAAGGRPASCSAYAPCSISRTRCPSRASRSWVRRCCSSCLWRSTAAVRALSRWAAASAAATWAWSAFSVCSRMAFSSSSWWCSSISRLRWSRRICNLLSSRARARASISAHRSVSSSRRVYFSLNCRCSSASSVLLCCCCCSQSS
mmetsp:Transcript_142948/g.249415  ORF Transcript_142948/g.249415 Transcript_142948/m.249415 type:complete len:230 (+) Transcript_142948:263-952(+)